MILFLSIALLLGGTATAQTPGDWSLAGNMSTARGTGGGSPTAVVLADGTVLVVGGASSALSDLYNPVTNSWTAVGPMSTARNFQAGTLLANGSVLVTGGQDENGVTLASAEIYNPTTQTWTLTGSMTTPRYLHSASLLPNGDVLVAGGWPAPCCTGSQTPLASSELWNPTTGTWSAIGNMANPHADQTATVLSNGNVLIAGGQNYAQGSLLEVEESAATELYNYATGTWTSVGNMLVGRDYSGAVLLSNGSVLEAGGAASGCCSGLSTAEIFSPTTMAWTAIPSMSTGRNGPAVSAILNAASVLVSGGYSCCSSPTSTLSSAEYYDSATQSWHLTGSLNQARAFFTSVTLQDGTVLAVGGGYASAERYYPNPNDQSVTIQLANTGISPVSFSITGTECSPGTYASYGEVAVNWTPGSSCQVTAIAPSAWNFTNWSDGSTANPRTFIAPTVPTTYTAAFSQSAASYQLSTAANPTKGGKVSPASGSYPSGATVNLSATPNSGYVFTGWTGNVANPNNASTTVTMNASQSVTANFSAVSSVRVTVGTSPAGLSFTVDGIAYTSKQTLTWTSGSSHTIATTSPQVSSGTQNTFASWSDGGAISHSVSAPSSAATLTASFNTSYQLTTAASPTGDGTVLPATGAFYASGAVVNLSATASSGYTFSGWTGNVANASNASTTVTMNAPQSVIGNFTSATAPASGLTFTPPIVSFGTLSLSGGSSQILTVTNTGTTAVKFTKIWLSSLQGATSEDLTYDGGCRSSLAAGKTCQITLSLWPSQTGLVSAILNLQDTAVGSPQQISVTATVTSP